MLLLNYCLTIVHFYEWREYLLWFVKPTCIDVLDQQEDAVHKCALLHKFSLIQVCNFNWFIMFAIIFIDNK